MWLAASQQARARARAGLAWKHPSSGRSTRDPPLREHLIYYIFVRPHHTHSRHTLTPYPSREPSHEGSARFDDLLDLLLDRSARSIEICSICCLEFAAACSYDGWLLPGCCTRALYLIHAYAQLLLCIRGYPRTRTAVRVYLLVGPYTHFRAPRRIELHSLGSEPDD